MPGSFFSSRDTKGGMGCIREEEGGGMCVCVSGKEGRRRESMICIIREKKRRSAYVSCLERGGEE